MKKIILLSMLCVLMSGCTVAEWLLSDVGGLDLSACVRAPTVCWDLYFDNIDNIPQE